MLSKEQHFILNQGKFILADPAHWAVPLEKPIQYRVAQLLNQPFSVYILNAQGDTIYINEFGAEVCGYDSPIQSVGKSLFDVSKRESAQLLIENCQKVMSVQSLQIFDEINVRKDNRNLQFLSIKLPWLSTSHEIMGSIGFSIVLGENNLSESLFHLMSMGILTHTPSRPILTSTGPNLTPREQECLKLTLRHYTAKQIAKSLGLSYRTIEEYLANLKQKFDVNSKQALIQKVLQKGLYT